MNPNVLIDERGRPIPSSVVETLKQYFAYLASIGGSLEAGQQPIAAFHDLVFQIAAELYDESSSRSIGTITATSRLLQPALESVPGAEVAVGVYSLFQPPERRILSRTVKDDHPEARAYFARIDFYARLLSALASIPETERKKIRFFSNIDRLWTKETTRAHFKAVDKMRRLFEKMDSIRADETQQNTVRAMVIEATRLVAAYPRLFASVPNVIETLTTYQMAMFDADYKPILE